MQKINRIDEGRPFDWGKTSGDYARYRDIYPEEYYRRLQAAGLCQNGQRVLDLGTGTGVLPRAFHRLGSGARFTGVDIAPAQVEAARQLSAEAGLGEAVRYLVGDAQQMDFEENSFDAATASQCFHYFEPERLIPRLKRWLVRGGRLAICAMEWLPFEDEIARRSEALVLKYSPGWSGAGVRRVAAPAEPEWAAPLGLRPVVLQAYELRVPFTRQSWNGRMKACRGVGASLEPVQVAAFEAEHLAMLEKHAPESFEVLHQATLVVLQNGG